jgi:adenylyltransferase/sulfurtransferase
VEAIKILLGVGRPLVDRLILYDALKQRFTELKVERNPDCAWCGEGAQISEYPDYEQLCATALT